MLTDDERPLRDAAQADDKVREDSDGGAAAVEATVPDDGDPALKAEVFEAIKTVRDPELPVNLVDLGLIYDVAVNRDGLVRIVMTLTAPTCPVAESLPAQVQNVVALVPGVCAVLVDLVWDPPWTKDRMSPEAMLELGLV